MRIRALAIAAIAAAVLLAGCGGNDQNVKSHYTQDGYMGISNSNPNLRLNPHHHTYRKDRQLMRQALREIGLDKQSNIVINGADVNVTIYIEDRLTQEETEAIRADAYSLLKGNNPRYNYNIQIR